MHESNRKWLKRCKKIYSGYFVGDIRILECGSLYINGSVREHFGKVTEYTGSDWKKGKNVDVVTLAHEFEPKNKYDTIISSSMLEHDPYWERSLEKLEECMKDDGIMLLSWQAAKSVPHGKRYAPDGKYHALKAERVIEKLRSIGIYVHEFHYESKLFPQCGTGWGPVSLIGFKNKKMAKGKKDIENFFPQDKK